jgi:hypothetical protein
MTMQYRLIGFLALASCLPSLDGIQGGGPETRDAGADVQRPDVSVVNPPDASVDAPVDATVDADAAPDVVDSSIVADGSLDGGVDSGVDSGVPIDSGIPNGAFEQGSAECGFYWSPRGGATLRTVPGKGGGRACEVCVSAQFSGVQQERVIASLQGMQYLSYAVATAPGKTAPSRITAFVAINRNGTYVDTKADVVMPTANWSLFERPVLTAEVGDTLSIGFSIEDAFDVAEQCLLVDNVGLSKIP